MTALARAVCDDCGFDRTYRSQAKADYALRRHSCDKARREAAAHARGQARAANVDRTPKPCRHKRADHRHGTKAAYTLDRCRCAPCSKAATEYERRRTRQAAYGRWQPYVDAQPARDHVRALEAAGVGLKRITALSGVSGGMLNKLMYGRAMPDGTRRPSARIRQATADALLAVRADQVADGVRVDNTGTVRRLQALVALGWSMAQLSGRLGIEQGNFTPVVHGRRQVRAGTARAVKALYDELWDTAPPARTRHQQAAVTRARNYARARGWPSPLAWDDVTIDDPAAAPDFGHAERRRGVDVDDAAWLLESGCSLQETAHRLGVTVGAVQTAFRRAGRPVPGVAA